MSLDGIVVRALAHELNTRLENGRIDKVTQPESNELILQIRVQREQVRLLLSVNPSCPMVVLTDTRPENPMTAPMFCMLLRKHLQGGRILSVGQAGMDRIFWLDIESRDELGDLTVNRLHIELMGKHSNIILINTHTGKILDSIHRIPESISRVRQVLPGITFYPLDVTKKNLLDTDEPTFRDALSKMQSDTLAKGLLGVFEGFSPLMAREILFRAGLSAQTPLPVSGTDFEVLWKTLCQFRSDLENHRYNPVLMMNRQNQPEAFSATDLTHLVSEQTTALNLTSMSEALVRFYTQKAQDARIKQKSIHLRKVLQTRINRLEKKTGKLQEDLFYAENADESKIMGELLTANLYRTERGMSMITVADYYDPDQKERSIPLDVRLTPAENAQKYYHKYSKLKTAHIEVQKQLEETRAELDYLEAVMTAIDTSQESSDIEQIQGELVQQGFLKSREKSSAKKKNKEVFKPLCYLSDDGFEIHVGRNNLENDRLTLKTASNADLWFHTKEIPGSHTVIRTQGQPVSEQTLFQAACIAAWHSKGRSGENVPVDYTMIRHVRKPQGARPGMVIYDHQKTLYVTPKESEILGWKKA